MKRTHSRNASSSEVSLAGNEAMQLLGTGRRESAGHTKNESLAGQALEVDGGSLRRMFLEADVAGLENLALLRVLGQEGHDTWWGRGRRRVGGGWFPESEMCGGDYIGAMAIDHLTRSPHVIAENRPG